MATRKAIQKGRGYAGLEKIPVYQYDEKGNFMKEWESLSDLRYHYYPRDRSKRPLLRSKRANLYNYDILPDRTFYSLERLGRKIVQYEKIFNSKFVINRVKEDRNVGIYNIVGDKIAHFENAYIASLLTNIGYGVILKDCNEGKGKIQKELSFRFENIK